MHYPTLATSLAILFALTGCARVMPPSPTSPVIDAPVDGEGASSTQQQGLEHGHASYYADSLAGHRTSSGEPYDPAALTAAHRTLPFGTWVDVQRSDGRTVRVRINDRGPYGPHGRIIDLSRRAAREIGMIRDGVVEVTVRVVAPASEIAGR